MTTKNGKQIGLEHLETFDAYLAKGSQLPVSAKDGTLNLKALAEATGIPKSSFYQNPKIEARLEVAMKAQGLVRQGERQAPAAVDANAQATTAAQPAPADGATVLLKRQMHRLEQQNAVLVAENGELRRQLKSVQLQLGRDDMQIETGRRVLSAVERK